MLAWSDGRWSGGWTSLKYPTPVDAAVLGRPWEGARGVGGRGFDRLTLDRFVSAAGVSVHVFGAEADSTGIIQSNHVHALDAFSLAAMDYHRIGCSTKQRQFVVRRSDYRTRRFDFDRRSPEKRPGRAIKLSYRTRY